MLKAKEKVSLSDPTGPDQSPSPAKSQREGPTDSIAPSLQPLLRQRESPGLGPVVVAEPQGGEALVG